MAAEGGATRQEAGTFFLADVGHYLYERDTALHIAAAGYRRKIAERLVTRGADCRASNRRGAEPLHYAADAGRCDPAAQADMIAYLTSIGAHPNARNKDGVAPLHRAVRTRSLAAVRALIEAGADPTQRNKHGSTPLHLAVQNTGRGGSGSEASRRSQADIITFLLDHGARATDKDDQGKSVHEAATSEWIRDLLAESAHRS